jgi:hypothetical protein
MTCLRRGAASVYNRVFTRFGFLYKLDLFQILQLTGAEGHLIYCIKLYLVRRILRGFGISKDSSSLPVSLPKKFLFMLSEAQILFNSSLVGFFDSPSLFFRCWRLPCGAFKDICQRQHKGSVRRVCFSSRLLIAFRKLL